MKFLKDIDLDSNEALQARLENLASAPATSIGRVYFNTTDNTAYCWTGTAWKDMLKQGDTGNGSTYDDVFHFGDGGDIEDKYIKTAGSNHTSLDSTYLALFSGEIVHVAISTEKKPENNFYVQIVEGAIKGVGSSPFYGGSQVGTDLEKTAGIDNTYLDKLHKNLTGFNFSEGGRISVRINKGTLGDKKATEPVVSLYVKYT